MEAVFEISGLDAASEAIWEDGTNTWTLGVTHMEPGTFDVAVHLDGAGRPRGFEARAGLASSGAEACFEGLRASAEFQGLLFVPTEEGCQERELTASGFRDTD